MRLAFLLFLTSASVLSAAPAAPPQNQAAKEILGQVAGLLENGNASAELRGRVWCEIARLRHKIGDREGALKAVRLARSIIEKHEPPIIEGWKTVGETLAWLGETKAVPDLAKSVPESRRLLRDEFRQAVSWQSALMAGATGNVRGAVEIADSLPKEDDRRQLKADIYVAEGVRLARKGDLTGAFRIVGELSSPSDKLFALVGKPKDGLAPDAVEPDAGIAFEQWKAGDKVGAKESTMKALALLPDVESKSEGPGAVAVIRMFARLDALPEARKALNWLLTTPPEKGIRDEARITQELHAWACVAAAEIRAGRDENAMVILKYFKSPGLQASLLQFIALAQAQAGRKEASKASFAKAVAFYELGVTKVGEPDHDIIGSLLLAGDIDGAILAARRLMAGPPFWASIAIAQADLGDFDGARKTADAILKTPDTWHAAALRHIARRQTKAGQSAEARGWASQVTNDSTKIDVLMGLAEGLAHETAKPAEK
ncbi:hypothetical protein [Zavarzinella formosa]|uniref:hypothetical protein n=1 Tax=Zavarzinella formosa TaxID=360055 RepID=UPI000304C4E7|nr:hypothetical protein [Zavarzinella formosa]